MVMKKIHWICLLLLGYYGIYAQNKQQVPKLVIGIVIDQMRYDYLIKFQKNFTKGGFNKLMNEGIFLQNVHYNYVPTYTGPGHASIFTGTTPRYHGIIANDWYDKFSQKIIYCTEDDSTISIGTNNTNGRMSPKNLVASTITDELKLMHHQQSKVTALSIKDRSAILPAGHIPDGAYWWDGETGNFISSSFYTSKLPEWVIKFNQQNLSLQYLQKNWDLLLPKEKYISALPDSNPYEKSIISTQPPRFPYLFSDFVKNKKVSILKYTPYGNSILIDLAKECIVQENLGKNNYTDFLCISFSSTDYIGHLYGTESLEIEDTYYRLDRDINNFITFLDKHIGKNNYLLFLTADHAAALNTQYLKDNHFPVHYFNEAQLEKDIKNHLLQTYKDTSLVHVVMNGQIFLNTRRIQDLNINIQSLKQQLRQFCYQYSEIAEVYLSEELIPNDINGISLYHLIANGFSPSKSGDVVFALRPQCMENYAKKGTTHGSGYAYDTHVPLIFYGFKFKHVESTTFYRITQIAPTLAYLLNINIPNACFDSPIQEVLDNVSTFEYQNFDTNQVR